MFVCSFFASLNSITYVISFIDYERGGQTGVIGPVLVRRSANKGVASWYPSAAAGRHRENLIRIISSIYFRFQSGKQLATDNLVLRARSRLLSGIADQQILRDKNKVSAGLETIRPPVVQMKEEILLRVQKHSRLPATKAAELKHWNQKKRGRNHFPPPSLRL